MKKFIALILVCLAMMLAACSSRKSGKQIVLGWVCPAIAGNEMYTVVTDEMQRLAQNAGVKLISSDAQMDEAKQVKAVEDFIAQGVNAIIIDALNPDSIDPYIVKAQNAGIKIVAGGTGIYHYDAWGLVDQVLAGECAAEEAVKYINTKFGGAAKIGYLSCPTNINITDRMTGYNNVLKVKSPDSEIKIDLSAITKEEGVTQTENIMQAHPDIRVLMIGHEDAALGAVEALRGMGYKDEDFGIFTVNGSPTGIKLVSENTMLRCTVRFELEKIPSQMINASIDLINGKPVPKMIPVSPMAVTIENAKDFL